MNPENPRVPHEAPSMQAYLRDIANTATGSDEINAESKYATSDIPKRLIDEIIYTMEEIDGETPSDAQLRALHQKVDAAIAVSNGEDAHELRKMLIEQFGPLPPTSSL